MPAPGQHPALPDDDATRRLLRRARRDHQRVLQGWTIDLLALRHAGMTRTRWEQGADSSTQRRRAA